MSPGPKAKKTGKRLKRGKALQVMTYPRARTKSVLVEGARAAHEKLSSFMIKRSLEYIAAKRGCEVNELIPSDEYEALMASGRGKRNGHLVLRFESQPRRSHRGD